MTATTAEQPTQIAINDIGTEEELLAAIDATIKNFNDGDILQIQKNINGLSIESSQDVAAYVKDHHGNAVITLGNEQITLVGVKAEDVQNDPNGFINIH